MAKLTSRLEICKALNITCYVPCVSPLYSCRKGEFPSCVGAQWPQDESLVDGTNLGLPVMGIFMNDVGYQLENSGVTPDIEVTISPQVRIPSFSLGLVVGVR